MSNYSQILHRLYSVDLMNGMKLGLDNVQKLRDLLGQPDKHYDIIHVAGTNGKGSVAHKIARGLESRYARVGLYSSPHIASFRERIKINREMISEEDVVTHLEEIFCLAEETHLSPTYFELVTLLALKYFAAQGVDAAVIETGLGGRLDATNIVSPILAVITSIHYDHTEILGHSLEEIADEKAGIIKPGVPVVLGSSASLCPVKDSCQVIQISESFQDFHSENRTLAAAALTYLKIPSSVVNEAIRSNPSCRMERFTFRGVEVILDVAHNPNGLEQLFRTLGEPEGTLRVICGFSKAKDHPQCLKVIQHHANDLHLVGDTNGLCASPLQLKEILQGSLCYVQTHESIEEGVTTALDLAKQRQQKLLICGSFYIMSDARKTLGIVEPRDQ